MNRYIIRRGNSGVIHQAIQEGGGRMVLMMTLCGLSIRWDLPHHPWQRARVYNYDLVTCKKCLR